MPTLSDKFLAAYKELLGIEGGYSNDPDDPGGETIYGWARHFNPDEAFWPIVDKYKKQYGGVTEACKKAMLADTEIKSLAQAAYKKKFWDIWGADNLPYSLSKELFEQAINLGVGGCAKNLQNVLNAMNYTKTGGIGGYGPDLKDDGVFGEVSKDRFDLMIKAGYAKVIQFGLNCEQGASYRLKTVTIPIKRKYYKGWISQRCDSVFMDKPGVTQPLISHLTDTTSHTTVTESQSTQTTKLSPIELNTIQNIITELTAIVQANS